ncbi:MAG: hypothetical protein A2W86_07270 [Bacteroidetes bacterium GWD2_45_23]|jgi:hypothetical protein|nr:MAG: hypothetical protein A2W87_03625 [Bacteroidetes bacterium GWC2_46_850]OFX72384.1 MAG: hypothetical protein A2071_01005 [Bacteroidetes bacterium GWC1_47_7]OFX82376.1 MAG: hypothetical protein A2W86_07270 [Bacteroidetes bacterium GWD2_45_23]HBB01014.1 hypothetical protein [Porphyromonadaceae bacterium]HCC18855.1 hypothetical protein [Porphyromonadaceae bacterium]
MENIYGNWIVKFSLKGIVAAPAEVFFTDVNDFYSDRLAYWGIIPSGSGKFNPNGTVTYSEMTDLEEQELLDMMEIIEDRHGLKSTIAEISIVRKFSW